MAETTIKPVEYWNPKWPNEILVVRPAGRADLNHDGAADPIISFMGGYFRATEQWQIDAIDTFASDRAFRSDVPEPIRCQKCGWETHSTRAFAYHAAQES